MSKDKEKKEYIVIEDEEGRIESKYDNSNIKKLIINNDKVVVEKYNGSKHMMWYHKIYKRQDKNNKVKYYEQNYK
jgi:hypothetical protein